MARQSNNHKDKPRKPKQNNRFANPRKPDIKAIKGMAVCGHVRAEYIEDIWSARRIRSFTEERLIEKVSYATKKGSIVCYKLTERGVNYAKKYIIPGHQIYASKSIVHDVYMSDHYFTKMSDTERETIKTETEIKSEFKEMLVSGEISKYTYDSCSCVDFSYTSDSGEIIGYEVVTDNYTQQDIQAKQTFCRVYGCTYQEVRAQSGGVRYE